MGDLDEILRAIKKQTGQEYRMVSLDPAKVGSKKLRGFNFVLASDPEVKGTILAKDHKAPDSKIQMGNLALARISKEDAQKHRDKIAERPKARLRGIKETYLREGENIKRQMGKDHSHFKPIFKVEEE